MKIKLFLLLISGLVLTLSSCAFFGNTKGTYICPVSSLLIKKSDYPEGTIFDPERSPIDEKPKESVSRSSYYYDSWVRESVIRYSSAQKAQEAFIGQKISIFHPNEVYDTWKAPVNLEATTIFANQYEIMCGKVKNFGNRCVMLAQYDEYIIFFSVDISKNGISQELFTDLAIKLDSQSNTCVEKR